MALAAFAVAVAIISGCGGEAARRVADPEAAVLRAGDMPRGYVEGDDTVCGLATTEGDDPQLEPLFAEERPHGCIIELERVWDAATGPPGVTSAAFVFRDAGAAERGFRARTPLLEYTASLTARTAKTIDLGDDARLVAGRGLNDPAVAVVWRSGNVVAMLAVEPANTSAALDLARRQQRRIQRSAPPPRTVDTVELELDDPALRLPVYWLRRSFDPRGALPLLTLEVARELRTGPGSTVELDYGGGWRGHAVGVTIDLWQPDAWRRFLRTRLGRLVWDSPCTRTTRLALPDGRAEIFQGYGTSRPLGRPCPARPPDRVIAHAYLRGAIAAVDLPYCYGCAEPPPLRNPYETPEGMKAIVRGLELRRR